MWHERPTPGSWKLSRPVLDGAIHFMMASHKLVDTYDVPYVAGYSKDGKTLYIDSKCPKIVNIGGKKLDLRRYILFHEAIEKAVMEADGANYIHSHQIALRSERDAVECDGFEWAPYNAECMKIIKSIGSRQEYPQCPKKLDLQPYKDENDLATLKKMKFIE